MTGRRAWRCLVFASLATVVLAEPAGAASNAVTIDGPALATTVAIRVAPTTSVVTASASLLVVSGDDGVVVNFGQMVTSPGACSIRYEGIDPLPDPTCTPGVTSDRVNQSDIRSTICASGYTASVRPSSSATNKVKAANYIAYAQTADSRDENDHLVPLELGGANDPRNLWNEPPTPGQKATTNLKDTVEGRLHDKVCAGTLSLADAQRRIVADWTTALTGT